MSKHRRPPPPTILQRPSTSWSSVEFDEAVRYVMALQPILLTVARTLRNRAEVVEAFVSSDALLRALKNYDPARGDFVALLLLAFQRYCADHLHERRHDQILEQLTPAHDGSTEPATITEDRLIEAIDGRRTLALVLPRLRSRDRRMLIAWANGASMQELADNFDLKNDKCAKTILSAARFRLRAAAKAAGIVVESSPQPPERRPDPPVQR